MTGSRANVSGQGGVTVVARPAIAVLLTAAVSLGLYYNLWRFLPPAVHRPLATMLGIVSWLAIGLGPFVIAWVGRRRGAGLPVVFAASLLTPLAWDAKEVVRVSCCFPLAESLYFGLNTVFLLIFFGAIGQIGLYETISRLRARRNAGVVVVERSLAGPLAAVVVGLAAVWVFAVWGGGTKAFYLFTEGYKVLFH